MSQQLLIFSIIIKMISDSSEPVQAVNNYLVVNSKVGGNGPYQWIIYLIILGYWLFYATIANSISLLYLDTEFDCSALDVSEIECEHYICEHVAPSQRHLYLKEKLI